MSNSFFLHDWRNRFLAAAYPRLMVRYENFVAPVKQQLMSGIGGRVVEIGPGTGENLPYCRHARRWIGLEPNRFLHSRLRKELGKTQIASEILEQPAEIVDLPDCSFDAVIGTLVLCTVNDPEIVLAKVLKWLKPGGVYFFIEHVLDPHKKSVRRFQRTIKPLWRLCAGGCRPDLDTLGLISLAGFEEVQVNRFYMPANVVPWFLRAHIAGCAMKSGAVNVEGGDSSKQMGREAADMLAPQFKATDQNPPDLCKSINYFGL